MVDAPHEGHALPLKGYVLCSTSLNQDVRTLLVELSNSMGATHRLDLTTDVTHLIVGQLDTPKYKHVAKERPDITVLKPEWIDAMRDAWKSGDDFSVSSLVDAYQLPSLYGLQICVTGFDDLDQRQYLMHTINEQGATYNGDLTKAVTHLIAKRPEGPKYDRARQWGLKIVSLKWFEESLLRGMALEESLYDPLLPDKNQGQGAYIRNYTRASPSGKRTREDAGSTFAEENGKRKLRRTASSRLKSHSQNMWAEMSAVDDAVPVKSENDWNDTSQIVDETTIGPPDEGESRAEPDLAQSASDISRPASRATGFLVEPKRGLFSDSLFHVMGHPKLRFEKIVEILQNEGGQIADVPENLYAAVESQSHNLMVLIVPSEWTANAEEPIPDVPADTWIVTEWWIERCIVSKSIIDPEVDVYSRPRQHVPNDCFKDMVIGSSGLGNDTKMVQAIARSTGATYEEHFKPTCSVLIVRMGDANKEKIAYAVKHKVPVVLEDWFISSIDHGESQPMERYKVEGSRDTVRLLERGRSNQPQETKRKDESSAQRLSVTRKKGVVPSLKLVKSHAVQPAHKSIGPSEPRKTKQAVVHVPFTEEDDSSADEGPPPYVGDAQLDGCRSQPLQELPSYTINSPEKRSQEQSFSHNKTLSTTSNAPDHSAVFASTDARPTHTTDVDENILPPPDSEKLPEPDESIGEKPAETYKNRLGEDIKLLLDRRKEAPASVELPIAGRKRKERKLGRAPSNMSNPSAPTSLLHSKSIEIADSTASASPLDLNFPIPSQQLGYETADAREHRARMSKRMGTNFTEEGVGSKRVESIGVVKDVEADSGGAGVGGRVRGRHRNAKA